MQNEVMKNQQLHPIEVSILYALRHQEYSRFSDLRRPTNLESDSFKFYLRNLVKWGHVEKLPTGPYSLTAKGKEFANNLDEAKLSTQRQPKLSVLLVAPGQPQVSGERLFLFQKRLRNPYYGFWSCIGGPIAWGEEAEDAAARELKKQTSLMAKFTVGPFYRQRDYDSASHNLLEDKLFIVLKASNIKGELANSWHGGLNKWMTLAEFEQQPKRFISTANILEMLHTGQTYTSHATYYNQEEY